MKDVRKDAVLATGYRNVVGFSNYKMPKISDGKYVGYDAIRVYVKQKLPENRLRTTDLLPKTINGYAVDVVEIGEIYAVPPTIKDVGRREVVRPLVSGIGGGNWTITTGTIGVPATYTDGMDYMMTNAHVGTPDPSKEPLSEEEKRFVQPGKYDGGILSNKVGNYFWHDRIIPNDSISNCPLGGMWAGIGNAFAKAVGAETRFKIYVEGKNYQDLSAIKLDDGIDFDITRTYDFDIADYDLCARIFAGSNTASILCKLDYQLASGFIPVVPYVDSTKFGVGAQLRKSGRTTFDTDGTPTDMSATLTINYGNYYATQNDVIVTSHMCDGGDSGSDVWINLD